MDRILHHRIQKNKLSANINYVYIADLKFKDRNGKLIDQIWKLSDFLVRTAFFFPPNKKLKVQTSNKIFNTVDFINIWKFSTTEDSINESK